MVREVRDPIQSTHYEISSFMSVVNAISAIELLSIGSRTIADHPGQWGPSWLTATPVETTSKPAETPVIPELPALPTPTPTPIEAVYQADACPKCGSAEFRDTPIHDGQSTRRDCSYCHRTWGFPIWTPLSERHESYPDSMTRVIDSRYGRFPQ